LAIEYDVKLVTANINQLKPAIYMQNKLIYRRRLICHSTRLYA